VLADLSKLGFDARWGIVGADFVGAPHRRERFWLVANSVATDHMTGQTSGITYTGKRFVRTSQKTGTEFGAKLTSAYRLMTGSHLPANFSEWMMGWPQDWTELKPVETGKFQKWRQQLGKS
jgi:site-specific DNA-cytosine methylase